MSSKIEQNGSSKVQSVDRTISILETLSNFPSLSLNDLSEQVKLHKATTHRLVQSLVENGFVEQLNDTKQYRISLRMFELGNKRVQNIDFVNVAKSNIRQLSQDINEIIHLVIEDKDEVLYIDKYGIDQEEAKMRSKIGHKAPLYCTAVGKAILATRSRQEVEAYWEQVTPDKKTEKTITEFDQLMLELAAIREQGYALDDEEFEYGVVCVGAVFSSYKETAAGAISISLPINKKPEIEFYIDKAVECSKRITQLLGGNAN